MNVKKNTPGKLEFMILMAGMTAVEAFSIDAIAPGLGEISNDLNVRKDNYRQFVITGFSLGYSIGLIFYGFLADHFGRRMPVLIGFLIYLGGSITCVFADSFSTLMIGRVAQGIGGAAPYVIAIAIVRDKYSGQEMASMLSLILMVFMGVPIIAPFIGQGFLLWFGWRSIFMSMALFGVIVMSWFFLRQSETLADKHRIMLSVPTIKQSVREVIACKQAMRYVVVNGVILGAFFAFLSTGQQIFQEIHGLGVWFPAVYALLSSVIGLSSYFNSKWVEKVGVVTLVHRALTAIAVVSLILLLTSFYWVGSPPLWAYMIYMFIVMFNCGLLFGNVMSLTMESMGERAGAASSLINSASMFFAIIVATLIGTQLKTNSLILVVGFFVCSAIGWGLNFHELRSRTRIA
ncbi:MAG: Bcr/CflA family efflux MFS transporter [Gammaproteobacteria bacterium]|nr:Bcr/CflA family efflux MFS transporter [Gammaproteobacteria bacterium]